MTTDIAAHFNAHVSPVEVLHRAGLRCLPDGRFTWPSINPHFLNAPRVWVRPNPDGRTATAAWCGLSFEWDTSPGATWKPNPHVTAFDLFRVLICPGDPAKAARRALRIPQVRALAEANMGALANV